MWAQLEDLLGLGVGGAGLRPVVVVEEQRVRVGAAGCREKRSQKKRLSPVETQGTAVNPQRACLAPASKAMST